jgi:hypothetical protein
MKKAKKNLFVIYSGPNEVLVTTPALEKKMLKEWFPTGPGRTRDVDAYQREITHHTEVCVQVRPRLLTNGNISEMFC